MTDTAQILKQLLSEPISNPFRWGNSISRCGEEISRQVVLALAESIPKGNVPGVPYNYNHAFDKWLTEAIQVIRSCQMNDNSHSPDEINASLDRYLIDCLPTTQPDDAVMVNKEFDWQGVSRLVKRARWYNKGYVPQHRIAIAIRSVFFQNATSQVGNMVKCLAQLVGPEQVRKIIRSSLNLQPDS